MLNKKLLLIFSLVLYSVLAFGDEDYKQATWRGSLMFSNLEIQELDAAWENYLQSYPKSTKKSQIEFESEILPIYYLNSIIYFDQKHCAIWLNNKKYGCVELGRMLLPGLKLISVEGSRAKFSWKSKKLLQIIARTRDKFVEQENGGLASYDQNMLINEKQDEVIFNLLPNQSLVIEELEIVSGHVEAIVNKTENE